jgi:hypothetical protein
MREYDVELESVAAVVSLFVIALLVLTSYSSFNGSTS